jgi:hypothetical protein
VGLNFAFWKAESYLAEDGFTWRGDEAVTFLRGASLEGLRAGAEIYRRAMRDALSAHDNEGVSPPGEVPYEQSIEAARRGRTTMADSVEIYVDADATAGPTVGVGTRAREAMPLEFGTATMLARPSWQRVLVENLGAIEAAVQEAATKAAKEAGG